MSDKKKEFNRDDDGKLVCDGEAGQDFKACNELKKKESLDDMPRDENGNLMCHVLKGDDKVICTRQKASETVRKSMGMKTQSDE